MFTAGFVVEVTQHDVSLELDGAIVEAHVAWRDGRLVIDRLVVHRGDADVIDTTLLRSISVPALLAAAGAGVKVWVDDLGTEPFDERQLPGETLEEWAARLAFVAVVSHGSAAEYVARVQGIKVSSANQRLVVARKMGLLDYGGSLIGPARTPRRTLDVAGLITKTKNKRKGKS